MLELQDTSSKHQQKKGIHSHTCTHTCRWNIRNATKLQSRSIPLLKCYSFGANTKNQALCLLHRPFIKWSCCYRCYVIWTKWGLQVLHSWLTWIIYYITSGPLNQQTVCTDIHSHKHTEYTEGNRWIMSLRWSVSTQRYFHKRVS